MGRNNQQRRAGKRRERARRASRARPSRPIQPEQTTRFGFDPNGRGSWSAGPVDDDALARHDANQKLQGLISRARMYRGTPMTRYLAHSEVLTAGSAVQRIMDEQLTARLLAVLTSLWEHGWQPADLLHVARRIDSASADLAAALVVVQADRLPMDRAPILWRSQLESAEGIASAARLTPVAPGAFRVVDVQLSLTMTLVDAWARALRLAAELEGLPPLARIVDPPSSWTSGRRRATNQPAHGERGKMMAKIRALLAKAEGTEYAAEAEALTAKAQDLMTRHAIDEALLHAHDEQPVDVATLRIYLQAPYAAEKMTLLTQVAHSNRCKAVWLEQLAMGTLVGAPVDVDQVELLFTSLLIQATRAMAEAGASRAGSYDRSAGFRRSFLVSYAVRIGERLTESAASATAEYGQELVPVLQRQADAVDGEFERLFPQTYAMDTNRRYSQRGWEAGREAADQATFVAGRLSTG